MEEIEYFRQGDTLVTTARVEIGGQTFAVRNIGSVKITQPGLPWVAGLICFLGMLMVPQRDAWWLGLILMGASGAWIWQKARTRTLVLLSGGGELLALKSTDHQLLSQLRDAIGQAISAR